MADSKDTPVRCTYCGCRLRDKISKLVGAGPDCARANRIAHTVSAARQVAGRKIIEEGARK
jgi:Family of unknown function (DUF6011)